MTIKFTSWNIWQSKHIPAVIEHLKNLNADIIGLQEVTVSEGVNAGDTIASALGYHHFFCKSLDALSRKPPISLGNSILSRYEFLSTACRFLSTADEYAHSPETEPRTAQIATISLKGLIFKTINTHLGFSPDLQMTSMQKKQLNQLISLLDYKPLILMGDFNSVPQSGVVSSIEKLLDNTDLLKNVPTRYTIKPDGVQKDRIDYIFVSHGIKCADFSIKKTEASDHAYLTVSIEL